MRRTWPALLLAAMLAATLSACVDIPRAKHRSLRQSTAHFTPRPEARQCLAALGGARAGFVPLADRRFAPGCSNLNTVRLASLRGDSTDFELSRLGPVTCPMAQAFAGWARYGVDRAARQMLGSPLARIETMGSYNCRNVAGSVRRSAHATASAIDVAGFVLADGRRVSVLGDWTDGTAQERAFLRLVHASACRRFGVVLGPLYDSAHRDHFHVELTGGGFCR